MGKSKLNAVVRDERCRLYTIQRPGLDWIRISNCLGETIQQMDIPVGEAHVEFEVYPGCYIVDGHVCEPGYNGFTDKAMVVVGCDEVVCTTLIVPKARTCVERGFVAIAREARRVGLPTENIRVMAQTMIDAVGMPQRAIDAKIERRIQEVEKSEEAADLVKEYRAILDIVRG